MTVLITGSSGHLGEGLMRAFEARGEAAIGLDVKPGDYTSHVGSIADRAVVARCMAGVTAVIHTATLHKPHVATHARQDFVDVNVTGTLNLLEEARAHAVNAFLFTSTTSVFGHAMTPEPGAPATWITEDVEPRPKNIYGVTKLAAEHLCALFHQLHALPCLILRTSRFFPEDDDNAAVRAAFDADNAKVNELLYRRVDLEDAVGAHLCALERAREIGFGRYIVSATTPFSRDDLMALRTDAAAATRRRCAFDAAFAARGWRMFDALDRVYVNARARNELGWTPRWSFAEAVAQLERDEPPFSALSRAVGSKGYHDEVFEEGPYPVEDRA